QAYSSASAQHPPAPAAKSDSDASSRMWQWTRPATSTPSGWTSATTTYTTAHRQAPGQTRAALTLGLHQSRSTATLPTATSCPAPSLGPLEYSTSPSPALTAHQNPTPYPHG